MYIFFFFSLFFTSRHIFYVPMLPVSACTILTFERREILDQSTFDTCSTHDFSNQNKLQQKCHQVGFFKNYKTTIKSFKNYYVLGFFENLAVFLFWFKTGNKKERQFRILLVFGAAKLMNSRNLVQGRYKTNTLGIHTKKLSQQAFFHLIRFEIFPTRCIFTYRKWTKYSICTIIQDHTIIRTTRVGNFVRFKVQTQVLT
jgi:hypothetical protein